MKDYAELEISIAPRDDDGTYPLEARSSLAGEARGSLRLPTQDPEYQELAAKFLTFETSEDILTRLGLKLFEALFQGQVRDLYLGVRTVVQNTSDLGLRIKLVIGMEKDKAKAAAEVSALPWEFLYDPDQGPLALLDCSIVRYPELPAPLPPLAGSLPLRVLLTSAVTPPPTTIAAELEVVRKALKELGDQVAITEEPHLTGPKLQDFLRRDVSQQFHVWHFVGHGGVGADGSTGMLALEDPNSPPGALADPFLFSALQLRLLLNRSGVRLIVLDACETARLGTDAFRSLAPALIRAQVPAVVAMQFPVPDDATVAFASAFYRSLVDGLPIDACVNEGRKAIMVNANLDRPDWGIPVVYTRAADGRLFELRGSKTAARTPEPQAGADAQPEGPRPLQPPPEPGLPSAPFTGADVVNSQVVSITGGNVDHSSITISNIQNERSGSANHPPDADLLLITGIGGAPLSVRTDDAVMSEAQFAETDNDLTQQIMHLQQSMNVLQRRLAIEGGNAPYHVGEQFREQEQQRLAFLQQRIELRLGRLEFLSQRQRAAKTASDRQQLEEQIQAVSYQYLSDAITLKNAELQQLQKRANDALDIERDQLLQQINDIRAQVGLLSARRSRLGLG